MDKKLKPKFLYLDKFERTQALVTKRIDALEEYNTKLKLELKKYKYAIYSLIFWVSIHTVMDLIVAFK